MKKSGIFLSLLMLIIGWQIISMLLANDVLMPYPYDVIKLMIAQCTSLSFYQIVMHTLWRSLSGLTLAFFCALLCAFLAFYNRFVRGLLSPLLLLMNSIPNISYIIIVLLWFGSEKSVTIIIFLIIFPMLYNNIYRGLLSLDPVLNDVLRIYPESIMHKTRKVYLPFIKPYIHSGLSSGLGLSFKVGVMAEIIGQVQIGIGRQLNISRLNFDMTGLFAWTGWIILLMILLDLALKMLERFFTIHDM